MPLYELVDISGNKVDELKVEQEKDEELLKVLKAIREGETLDGVKFTKSIPIAYEKLYKNLFIKSEVLCKKMLHQDKMVVMVPKSMKKDIMQQLHSAISQWTLSIQQNLKQDPREILLVEYERRSRIVL